MSFIETILSGIHAVYELIRSYWWLFFIGWWALWLTKAYQHRENREKKIEYLSFPVVFTAIGIVVSFISLTQVYVARENPYSIIRQCEEARAGSDDYYLCVDHMERQVSHYRSLIVQNNDGGIAPLQTWVQVFGDTVSLVQIVLMWLVPIFLFFRYRTPPSQPKHTPMEL